MNEKENIRLFVEMRYIAAQLIGIGERLGFLMKNVLEEE